jgi:6-phosphofructokinase 1
MLYTAKGTASLLVPLANVAGKTRHMPDDYMLPDVNHLSEKGMDYLRRLVPGRFKIGRPFV